MLTLIRLDALGRARRRRFAERVLRRLGWSHAKSKLIAARWVR